MDQILSGRASVSFLQYYSLTTASRRRFKVQPGASGSLSGDSSLSKASLLACHTLD